MLHQIKVNLSNCRSKGDINKSAIEIIDNPTLLKHYFSLASQHNFEDADKAAWILRTYYKQKRNIINGDQKKILKLISQSENEAVLRNISGIMADFEFDLQLEDELVNCCFARLNEDHHDVAVYANLLLALIPIVKNYPELKEEIKLVAERNPMKDKCAFQLRLKTILSLKS